MGDHQNLTGFRCAYDNKTILIMGMIRIRKSLREWIIKNGRCLFE